MSFTLWFTGLSGSGKTTISSYVYEEIRCRGQRAVLLDGDIVRLNISKGLGFSKADRNANVRRIGFISHLLNKNGVACVVAAIAPYAESRASNRALLDPYVEVFCDCPLEVTEARDVKGLYARARSGEIPNFTGVSDPYFPPEHPEIIVATGSETVEQSRSAVIRHLEAQGLVGTQHLRTPEEVREEESCWRDRLASLGFLNNGFNHGKSGA